MIIPKYRRPIEYINHKPYVLFGIIPINRVKNATLIKEWLGCDTAFKVHSKGEYWFCDEIEEIDWEEVEESNE
jgi:hypothetical protein